MVEAIQAPAQALYWILPGRILFLSIYLLGSGCFFYIVARRLKPLMRGERDFRLDRPLTRLKKVLQFWLGQWRHPRYPFAGTVHILIFAGFIILATRAFWVLMLGVFPNFVVPGLSGRAGEIYGGVADYASTAVFFCMLVAATRRLVFKPSRYV